MSVDPQQLDFLLENIREELHAVGRAGLFLFAAALTGAFSDLPWDEKVDCSAAAFLESGEARVVWGVVDRMGSDARRDGNRPGRDRLVLACEGFRCENAIPSHQANS